MDENRNTLEEGQITEDIVTAGSNKIFKIFNKSEEGKVRGKIRLKV